MRRLLIWLSGGDPTILRNCENLYQSEQIRFANLGALTLIPAILGMCGMSYALSTLTDQPALYLGGGLLWGLVVLTIDRYLISTLHKSSVRRKGGILVSVSVRLLFALLIGVAIAHPLVLLWFDSSIDQTIDENRRAAVTVRTDQATSDVNALPPVVLTAPPLQKQLADRVSFKDCLVKLQTYEQSNFASTKTECGVTSGTASCGPRCASIGTQITSVEKEIDNLTKSVATAQAADTAAVKARQAKADGIARNSDVDVADIDNKFSSDYLARVAALEQLEKRSPQVRIVELFMILFFVFVDIMPLMMKLSTPMGEYERVRDTAMLKAITAEKAKQEVVTSGEVEAKLARMYAESSLVLAQMEEITRVPVRLLNAWDIHRSRVEQQIDDIRRSARPGEELVVEAQILEFRKVDQSAWDAAMSRTLAFVSGHGQGP